MHTDLWERLLDPEVTAILHKVMSCYHIKEFLHWHHSLPLHRLGVRFHLHSREVASKTHRFRLFRVRGGPYTSAPRLFRVCAIKPYTKPARSLSGRPLPSACWEGTGPAPRPSPPAETRGSWPRIENAAKRRRLPVCCWGSELSCLASCWTPSCCTRALRRGTFVGRIARKALCVAVERVLVVPGSLRRPSWSPVFMTRICPFPGWAGPNTWSNRAVLDHHHTIQSSHFTQV